MKVTIDTKEDSHEDIQKVLQILTSILEKKEPVSALNADTTSMMNMFDSPSSQKEEDKAPDFSSFLHLQQSGNKKEEKTAVPKIEFF